MQPSTVPSLEPSLSTSVSVEAVAPTVTALSSSAEACIVREGTSPIPARLVRLIQAQEYVDFAEILPDNLEFLRRMQATAEPANRRRLRQITTLPTWVQCFATYAMILLRNYPAWAQEVMAYFRLVSHEAQCHSRTDWLLYDVRFWHLAASNRSLSWSQLHAPLFAAKILAMNQAPTARCFHCLKADHAPVSFALEPNDAPPQIQREAGPVSRTLSGGRSRYRRDRPWHSPKPICRNYNFSRCAGYPYCTFGHICVRCRSNHRMRECPEQRTATTTASGKPAASTRGQDSGRQ